MSRAVWLTWKMHRFEVITVVVLIGLLAVSTFVVTSHITRLGLSDACWPRTEDGNYATAACDSLMNQFWSVTGAEGGYLRIGLALIAPIAGLIIGVPVVARELEMRTTAFAWSLEAIRWRWLLSRALPMLLVAFVGFLILGAAGTKFFDSLATGRQTAALTEVASQGPGLMARGFLAVGIALLVGSIVGRTMPAFILAAVAVALWSTVGVGLAQSEQSRQYAAWAPGGDDGGWRDGVGPLAYIDAGQFDVARPGIDGEPGARLGTSEDTDRLIVPRCGTAPTDDTSTAWSTWNACYEGVDASLRWVRIVPASRFGDYVTVDTLLSLLIGGAAMLGTVLVVSRRRAA